MFWRYKIAPTKVSSKSLKSVLYYSCIIHILKLYIFFVSIFFGNFALSFAKQYFETGCTWFQSNGVNNETTMLSSGVQSGGVTEANLAAS